MKLNILGLLATLLFSPIVKSQTVRLSRESVKILENEGVEVIKLGNPLKLGVSVGYNSGFKSLYNATISPIDNTVQFERVSPFSVVLSTAAMFSVRTFSLRKKTDLDYEPTRDNTEGPVFEIPSRLSIGAILNIAQFSGQTNVYNQQIDGGLGIGYQLNENIFILGSLEFNSVKQPRDYFFDKYYDKNLPVLVSGSPLKSLNYDDTSLFSNKYVPNISLKIVFGLGLTKQSDLSKKAESFTGKKEVETEAETKIKK